ncbi:MAG: aspartate aminotransferase [Thermosediminibacterales bacterium]|jgi:aspartate aminotransferase|nr:aspartate aminotransferase [Thermosediminibacterales bacterium]MDK2901113.1 aspartate aminotransferase [Thermosediminibacterales bacterium]NPV42375.1 pyridoxal phosphate-dependent aminotransferase [Bacillota bacterium]
MELSKRAQQISPSITLSITAKARELKDQGVDVISFGAGEPDFDTPKHIQDEGIRAIKEGFTRYTAASGINELKEAICTKLKKENDLEYDLGQIVISNGAKHSLYNAFLAIINPGDEVIIPVPYWVSYPELVKLADGVPVYINLKEDNDFKIDVDELRNKITSKTKAIILNYPNNPTGSIYNKAELTEIAEIAVENNIYVISDEIYEKLIYDGNEHVSIASLGKEIKDLTILINGVSKAYSMTGWRIGYAAGNHKVIKAMSSIQSHSTSNPNSIAQKAAVAALTGDQEPIKNMVKEFSRRRDYMVDKLNSIRGITCNKPSGAFYVMANISKFFGSTVDGREITNSVEFAEVLLDKGEVAVIPGSAFGTDRFVRLSYATSMENIKRGLDKIEEFVKSIE